MEKKNLRKEDSNKGKLKKEFKNESKTKNIVSALFKMLFHGVLFYFSASYLITNTFTWGKKFPNWRRYIPVFI
ncbi:hypothetical protein LY90DRAFT_115535 [Neocallimastix californiae]|uniref:Uncharacterized protein n=1 Tax=Neocallimastix californiae TaxID=1754190 RepID=A0A1Y2APJ4_9FUNG|nr:hypothetical protein LY90DRAFT_115535 [Neocallimastix californiae]|eukprot:ORY24499.1 hypothetical protein LY90DRAFT_115535 [Neocallimastix californiae]